ncbi:MAG: hypothetical protein J6O50_15895 [Ruminiclostridium sp.]|nr:hypothetical protein [Ruminiclostridium sp.]
MNDFIVKGIDGIDDSLIEEAMNYKRTRKPIYIAAGAVAAIAVFSAVMLNILRITEPTVPTVDGGAQTDDSYSGGGTNYGEDGKIILSDAKVSFTGTAITAEEIREIIEREKVTIASFIRHETPGAGDINISLVGYSHLQTDNNTISLDFVTLPVFTEDRLIGEVTLFRYDGEIHYSPAAGGPGWEVKTGIFDQNPDSELAFVYVGQLSEYMIAPDNTVYGMWEGESPLDDVPDCYTKYATEYNTFSFNKMIADKNYVTVPADVSNITLQ